MNFDDDKQMLEDAQTAYQAAAGHYIRPGTPMDDGIIEMGRLLREKDRQIALLREENYELKHANSK